MKSKNFLSTAIFALGLALIMVVGARAQTASPPAPPPDEPTPAVVPPAPAPVPGPEAVQAPEAEEKSELRRLDTAEPEADAVDMSAPEPESAMADSEEEESEEAAVRPDRHSQNFPLGDHTVPEGQRVREVVSLLGNSTLDGTSRGAVVSIIGKTTVNGTAGGEAVAILGDVSVNGTVEREVVGVLGNISINGTVHGEVVSILGDVFLGPQAVVRGEIVTVGGKLHQDSSAVVEGGVQELNLFGDGAKFEWLKVWMHRCLLYGRPLAFGEHLGWAWMIALSVFGLYVLLALLFPRAFEKCAETLEQRPGYSLLAVLLTVLITPILIVLLVATGVGILLVPFVVAGGFFGTLFGKAVMHAWLGRRITKYFGPGPMSHIAVATLIGGGVLLLLYTVPVLGFLLWKVFGMIGFGVVVYTLILTMRSERTPPRGTVALGAVANLPLTASAPTMLAGATGFPEAAAMPALAQPPPTLPLSALPRAGFWVRIAASGLDAILVGMIVGIAGLGDWFLLFFTAYNLAFWAMKGTTVGGIVCNLKLIRLDDREIDWMVAIVRGLGAFLSLAVVGLGFIWVAFDPERQSWHDKIAGTVLVRMPKGRPLL